MQHTEHQTTNLAAQEASQELTAHQNCTAQNQGPEQTSKLCHWASVEAHNQPNSMALLQALPVSQNRKHPRGTAPQMLTASHKVATYALQLRPSTPPNTAAVTPTAGAQAAGVPAAAACAD
jgi:hypothetical protein